MGLASVATMTIAAYNVPAPAAYANTTTSVPLSVTVYGNDVSASITGNIQDGTETAVSPVSIPVIFSHAGTLNYKVTATQNGVTTTVTEENDIDLSLIDGVTDQGDGYAGTYIATLNLADYVTAAGFNGSEKVSFTIEVQAFGRYSGASTPDYITFTYSQIAINPSDNTLPDTEEGESTVRTEENGDPIIIVETGQNVTRIHSVILNADGNVIFAQDNAPTDNLTNVVLSFAEHNVKSGWYTIRAIGYDNAGSSLGSTDYRFYYAAPIGLPNTGGSIFAGLNIGKTDFLVSGLLVFGIAAIAGLYLMNRKSNKNSRTRK